MKIFGRVCMCISLAREKGEMNAFPDGTKKFSFQKYLRLN